MVCGVWWGLWTQFDEDRSGSVTHEEFRQSLATLGFNLSDFEFDKFVALYDPQGLGEISYQQFQDAVGAVIQPNVVHSRNRRKNFVRPRTPTLAEWWAHKLRGASLAKLDSGIEDAPLTLKGTPRRVSYAVSFVAHHTLLCAPLPCRRVWVRGDHRGGKGCGCGDHAERGQATRSHVQRRPPGGHGVGRRAAPHLHTQRET